MTIGQFAKSKGGAAAKAPPKKSRKWAGVKSMKPRDPILRAGDYRLRIERAEPGRTGDWFKVHFTIAEQGAGQTTHADGDNVVALFRLVDDAGISRCKAFFVAAAGFEDDDSYDAEDPDGAHIDAFFEQGDDSALAGRLIDVRVTRGKEFTREDGSSDYYPEYNWSPVEQ